MTEQAKTAQLMEIPVRTAVADWVEASMWMLSEPHMDEGTRVEFVASLTSGRLRDLVAATRDGDLIYTQDGELLMLVMTGIDAHGNQESFSVDEQFERIGYATTR